MRFSILTLFPEMFEGFLAASILGRALDRGVLQVHLENPREHAPGPHRRVDDAPYGGGPGMVMKADVLQRALAQVRQGAGERVIYLSPQGVPLTQGVAQRLAGYRHLILICGRYEGVDERLVEREVDEEISLGDFVLSGGEVAAMALLEAVSRLVPGVVKEPDSVAQDSFSQGLLDYPHYTRPAEWEGMRVPDPLPGGDHGRVDAWRRRQALLRTLIRRPDLLSGAPLDKAERRLLGALAEMLASMEGEG